MKKKKLILVLGFFTLMAFSNLNSSNAIEPLGRICNGGCKTTGSASDGCQFCTDCLYLLGRTCITSYLTTCRPTV